MQIFILHYYRAIPLIRCLRIYTKNDNNMATVGFYLDTRREKKGLMSYLIGIKAIDLFNLKQIVDGHIEYKREKTGNILYQSRTGSNEANKQV